MTPRHLGSLGVIDPKVMLNANVMAWTFRILTLEDAHKSALFIKIAFERWIHDVYHALPAKIIVISDACDSSCI